MIAPKDSFGPHSSDAFPNSRKLYVGGKVHPSLRVPFREIDLQPTKGMNGRIELNDPVRVYDTSGPWSDPEINCDANEGLPALRREWILARGDVEDYSGRGIRPEDNGYLSNSHAESAVGRGKNRLEVFPGLRRRPLRAKAGANVSQMHYARKGIVTPEMEYIAIRENLGRQAAFEAAKSGPRGGAGVRAFARSGASNILEHQHPGQSFGARIPKIITPEFVRDEVARGRAELYTNPDPLQYVELEMLGRLADLKKGDRLSQTNTYTLSKP